jgi:hypothetical protein
VRCRVTCPGSWSETGQCCNQGCGGAGSSTPTETESPAGPYGRLPDAKAPTPVPPPGVSYGFARNPTHTSRFTLKVEKPAVAAIVDIVYQFPGGQTLVSWGATDRPLRDGSLELTGGLGAPKGVSPVSSTFRVWYVEYEDGSTAGELDPSVARDVLEPRRLAVRRYAQRYAQLAREGIAAFQAALKAEKLPPELSEEDDIGRGMVQATANAIADPARLAERLELLSR